jgi:hypothetical protein
MSSKKRNTAQMHEVGQIEAVTVTQADVTSMVEAIMTAVDSREAFRQALLTINNDEARAGLVIACKAYQETVRQAQAQAQAQADSIAQAERELFGVPVAVQGNHRSESKGKQLTEALSRGATMTELLAIRGAVPQHFAYLKKHGFNLSYDKLTGIYKATA